MPVSLSLRRNLLYVLNAGGGAGDKDNVTAFIFANGQLLALPDSTQALSADNTGPAQVSFTRDGGALVVTERLTSLIDTFVIGDDGLAVSHQTFQSAGTTPFGFDVGRDDRLFISEAAGGSASSYSISDDGALAVISPAVSTKQAAPCWLLASHDGRFVYTANAGSGSISGFRVGADGSLELLDANGRTGVTGDGSHPVDMAQSRGGRFLYCLANGNGTLNAFKVKPNGSLEPLIHVSGIATSAGGLAGFLALSRQLAHQQTAHSPLLMGLIHFGVDSYLNVITAQCQPSRAANDSQCAIDRSHRRPLGCFPVAFT